MSRTVELRDMSEQRIWISRLGTIWKHEPHEYQVQLYRIKEYVHVEPPINQLLYLHRVANIIANRDWTDLPRTFSLP